MNSPERHWLLSAHERISAGESEASVMSDFGWAREPHWTHVSESLPCEGTWCWVWVGDSAVVATRRSGSAGGWTNLDTWEDFDGEVTHWSKLPSANDIAWPIGEEQS